MTEHYEHVECEVKIERANEISEEAKTLFRARQYHQALERFEDAFKCLLPSLLDEEDARAQLKAVEMGVLSNIAACQVKIGAHRVVVEICKKIQESKLLITPLLRKKTFYRRSCAELEIGNTEDAVMCGLYALEMDPESELLQNQLSRALSANDRLVRRERSHYRGRVLESLAGGNVDGEETS